MSEANILAFRHFRYAWLGAGLILLSSIAYLFNPEPGPPRGNTWVGYGLGTLAALLIVWLTCFGVRKRSYASRLGTVQGWLSAHVWLGLSLIVLATLHTGFQFHWNLHTLAYALMMVVIASGAWGLVAYFRNATVLGGLLDGRSPAEHVQTLVGIDAQSKTLAAGLAPELRALIEASARATLGDGYFGRLIGRRAGCPTRRAVSVLAPLARGPERALRDLYALQLQRLERLERLRRFVRVKAWNELWLMLHVPLTFALLAALTAHIVVVFTYW